jgi:outer membrane lipoprotein-sorting protein
MEHPSSERTFDLTAAVHTGRMREPNPHQRRRPSLAVATRPHPLNPTQIAGALAATLLVAAAAVAIVLFVIATTARAQPLDAEQVLERLSERAERLQDIAFVLEGELRDEAGQRIAVEIEVMAIRSPLAASLYIVQPDALADNMVVITEDAIRNYTFLTNQVAIYAVDDPDAFGGLLPGDQTFIVDLDVAGLFAGWEASVVDVETGAAGDVYTLRFDNLEAGAEIAAATAVIDAGDWLPLRLTFYSRANEVFADLRLQGVEVDAGLDPAEVTWIPEDAEVLDRR